MTVIDFLTLLAGAVLAAALIIVVGLRRRSYSRHVEDLAGNEVCEHLRPALELLRSRGHTVIRVGQNAPDYPLEIHIAPPFTPQAVYDELKLAEPVFVSERNVLFCKEDWCEMHPTS